LKELIEEIERIWGKAIDGVVSRGLDYTVFTLKKQLQEIEENDYDPEVFVKELTDILIITLRYPPM
jgi:hypothetical protein